MKFSNLQKTVRDLIAASPVFAAKADTTVLIDLGHARPKVEAALVGEGYAVAVWPPAKFTTQEEFPSSLAGGNALVVVRLEVSPQKLDAQADPETFVNGLVVGIVSAVLGAAPSSGGVKFRLAEDGLDLVNFDEGLLAYHIRFEQFAVFSG